MKRCATIAVLIIGAAIGGTSCSQGPLEPDAGLGCPTHDDPTFQLGTGASRFEPFPEGPIRLTPGPQGGCHIWLAIQTDGFAERRLEIAYSIFDLDAGQPTSSSSRQRVRLTPLAERPGICEFAGYTAFVLTPADLIGKHVRIDVVVTDDLGRTASASQAVVPEWPSEGPAVCMRNAFDAGTSD